MSATITNIPLPGHPEARSMGCKCPVRTNYPPETTYVDGEAVQVVVVTLNCKLHTHRWIIQEAEHETHQSSTGGARRRSHRPPSDPRLGRI